MHGNRQTGVWSLRAACCGARGCIHGQGSNEIKQGKEEAKGHQAGSLAGDIEFSQHGNQQSSGQQEKEELMECIAGGKSSWLPPGIAVDFAGRMCIGWPWIQWPRVFFAH
jgi:hypothetical protein